jgi:two-component system CheB/CheR fusion protein
MAFLLVQHLDPVHESVLAELLAKHTALRVTQVQRDEAIVQDHVYIIAPNTALTIGAGALHVAIRRADQPHTPIDELFQSLAAELHHRAIGVVLSGGGSDGTRGLGAIKEAGGLAFAQEPGSARFSSMPKSAIDSGVVDFIARPSEIAQAMLHLSNHPYLQASAVPDDVENKAAGGAAPPSEEEQLRAVFRLLRNASGVDFTHYKRSTIQRRLARRMALNRAEPLANYLKLLRDNANEQRVLVQDLLIRVTNFFRDPEAFEALTRTVFPALLKDRSTNDPLRIWVPGCASGEEVYSIAMCLFEYLGAAAQSTDIQFFGTDVSEVAIERARSGRYLHTIAAEVSAERLERFFVKLDDHYQIVKWVRDRCIFAQQNVARDPPFSRMDLISCRNLLIYLDHVLQRRALTLFHYALKPEGFLLLGASESVGQGAELFDLVDKRHHIYARKAVAAHLTSTFEGQGAHPGTPATRAATQGELAPASGNHLQREVDRVLVRFGPASLIVDDNLNIVEFRGDTGPYLELTSGAASLSLHRLARPGLLVALAPAIQEVRHHGVSARADVPGFDGPNGRVDVHLEVLPLRAQEGEARCYLIVLQQVPVQRVEPEPGLLRRWFGPRPARSATRAPDLGQQEEQIARLNRQLEDTRNFMRATMEEHEAVKEELKSAHEEVLSANEEFQSTNEELETAKEELQSTNEELATTNDELRSRNRELGNSNEALTDARDYADLIIETVRDPLLVLDSELRVMRANQAFYDTFKARPQNTEQCRIYELDEGQWDIATLRNELNAILPGDTSFRDFEVAHSFPRVGYKSLVLNARRLPPNKQRPEMILLAIEDVTERKIAAEALRQSESRFRALVDSNVIGMILQSDEHGHITEVNDAFLSIVGYTRDDLRAGRLRWDHMTPSEYVPRDRDGMEEANARGACTPYEKEYIRREGRRVPVLIGYAAVVGEPGNYVGFVLDLTQRKALEEDLRRHSEQLQQGARRKDEYLAMLAHELRNPLAPMRNAVELLRRIDTADATLEWSREVISRQVEHMTRIVDDLLDVSRITSGKISLHRSVLSLGEILEQALEAGRRRSTIVTSG